MRCARVHLDDKQPDDEHDEDEEQEEGDGGEVHGGALSIGQVGQPAQYLYPERWAASPHWGLTALDSLVRLTTGLPEAHRRPLNPLPRKRTRWALR